MRVDGSVMTIHISDSALCSKYARKDGLIPYSMRRVRPGSCWNRREAWSIVCAIILLYGVGYVVNEENKIDPKQEGQRWFRDSSGLSGKKTFALILFKFKTTVTEQVSHRPIKYQSCSR